MDFHLLPSVGMMDIDPPMKCFLEGLQRVIAQLVKLHPVETSDIETLCGLDVSYKGRNAVTSAVLWSIRHKEYVEKTEYRGEPTFPYIPGLLFMREGHLMLAALGRLHTRPSLILVDGHGIAHPRRAGIAVFVGLLSDIPTVGVAKSILAGELGEAMGPFSPIYISGSKVGYAVSPISGQRYYMSPGHKIGVEDILKIIQLIGIDYPQPLKEAHLISKQMVKEYE
jgi:deoxyribonuclease V